MKILYGLENKRVEDHAAALLRAIEAESLRHPYRATPLGIPMHAARFPVLCEDCGETFWASDPWASHVGCRKPFDRGTTAIGFSR